MKGKKICRTGFLAAAVLVIGWMEIARPVFSVDPTRNALLSTLISRILGAAAVFLLLTEIPEKPRLTVSPRKYAGLTLVLASLVSLNNGPWIGLLSGNAKVTGSAADILLLAGESLAVGLFEELAFRGLLFPVILEKFENRTFTAAFVSSLIFAAVHLVNLAEGAPGAVIMQVGYSFLIGGMCTVILLEWGSVWLCALLHGVYDFGGALIPRLGEGTVWDPATVTLTAVLGVITAAVFVWVLWNFDQDEKAP